MAHRKFLLAGVLLVAASACSQPEDITATAIVPARTTATMPQIVTPVPASPSAIPTVAQATPALPTLQVPDTPTLTLPPFTQTPLPADTVAPTSVPILGEHQIKSGETLSCIGRGYGVLPKAIADANGIQLTSILHVGQVLKIPAVQWTNIPSGPVCPPQFPSPFPGLPVTGPTPLIPDTPTPTPIIIILPTPSATVPTPRPPDTPTPTLGGPTVIPPGTP